MENILVLIFSSYILANLLLSVQGACVFPTHLQSGTWRSSRWDDIVFTTDEMTIPDFDGSALTFACDTISGGYYLIRSTVTKLILTNTVDVVACLEFSSSTTGVKQIYYHSTVERSLPGGISHPVRLQSPPGDPLTASYACTDTTNEAGSNDVMINVNAIADAVITCPNPLKANFDDYTVTDDGSTFCNGVGYIHICDDKQTVIVEYSICNKQIFYSVGGNLSCVYSSSSGGISYVNLLNNDPASDVDNTDSFHYTCVAVQKTGGVWYASQWPRKCTSGQTPLVVPSSVGYTFVMNANLTCIPSSGSSFNIIPIICAVVGVLICGGLIYFFCFNKKGKKKTKKMKKKMPCFKKDKKTKKSQVDPTSADVSMSAAPMDGHKTGLQATAVMGYPDRSSTITPFERRNLETAQSTRSAITVSHMETELVDDNTPRRLPPLMPHNPPNQQQESDTSDTPSIPPARLPPISEVGANREQMFNASSVSTSGVNPTNVNSTHQ